MLLIIAGLVAGIVFIVYELMHPYTLPGGFDYDTFMQEELKKRGKKNEDIG